jgi:hypothetical protein
MNIGSNSNYHIVNETLEIITDLNVFKIIIEYTTCLEIIAMSKSKNSKKKKLITPKILNIVQSIINCRVENKLKEIYQNYYPQFIKWLYSNGFIISGSFILHCIDDTIPYKDIDIYCNAGPRSSEFRSIHYHRYYNEYINKILDNYSTNNFCDTFKSIVVENYHIRPRPLYENQEEKKEKKEVEDFHLPSKKKEREEQEEQDKDKLVIQLIHCYCVPETIFN